MQRWCVQWRKTKNILYGLMYNPPPPRVNRNFFWCPQHNSTIKIVNPTFFDIIILSKYKQKWNKKRILKEGFITTSKQPEPDFFWYSDFLRCYLMLSLAQIWKFRKFWYCVMKYAEKPFNMSQKCRFSHIYDPLRFSFENQALILLTPYGALTSCQMSNELSLWYLKMNTQTTDKSDY